MQKNIETEELSGISAAEKITRDWRASKEELKNDGFQGF